MPDDLALWRKLLVESGFGVQNKLVIARPEHAAYVTRYISTELAKLAPGRRAYGFSRHFPQPEVERIRREIVSALAQIGARSECHWEPTASVSALLQ
jgi:hypothetical protein